MAIKKNIMDENTLDLFYDKYWRSVYNSAFKRIFDSQKASLITLEAFFQLWSFKSKVDEDEVHPFLLSFVKQEVLKLMEMEDIKMVYLPEVQPEERLPGRS